MSLYEIGKCSYCGEKDHILRPSPFMADINSMMCEYCWNETQKEYAASNGEYIPDFDSEKDEYNKLLKQIQEENGSKEYLYTNLKIFEFEDSETHWIVARSKEDAINFYENDYIDQDSDIIEEGYEVREISKDTKILINVDEDIDLLHIINRYRNQNEKVDHVNIWLYLKYWIVEQTLQNKKFIVPNLLASTVY